MAREPAPIRYKNPGAMWGSALAIKWGAERKAVTLNDGKGQGNNIAVFPTYVQGICAQLDLWRTSTKYKNKRMADAIRTWSGGNNVEDYIAFVLKRVPGMARYTVMDDAFWRSPSGIAFLKAQAWHEAGKRYPAPDEDWIEARRRVMGLAPVPRPKPPVPEQDEPDEPEPPRPAPRPQPDDPGPEPEADVPAKPGILAKLRNWVGSLLTGGGLFALDWKLFAAAGVMLLLLIVFLLWLFGRERIKAWVRRHFA